MKRIGFLFTLLLIANLVSAQNKTGLAAKPDSTKRLIAAEASCGQCMFGMKGSGCSLAVRIDGEAYYVDGAGIDEFGDAHAADGFCLAIRPAQVQGEIVDGRFVASYIKLVEDPKKEREMKAKEKKK
jgi:hypothetical protein